MVSNSILIADVLEVKAGVRAITAGAGMHRDGEFVAGLTFRRNPGSAIGHYALWVGLDIDGHVFGAQFEISHRQCGNPSSNQS